MKLFFKILGGGLLFICLIGIGAYVFLRYSVDKSLEDAQGSAQSAAIEASLAATVPMVFRCIGDDDFVNEPKDDSPICGSGEKHGQWLNLTRINASWGGCEMTVNREGGTFEYCATTPQGIARCTELGCVVPN